MILILTNKQDVHADYVIKRLGSGADVFRLNTEDILSRYRVAIGIDHQGRWDGEITDETGRSVNLRQLRVSWFRKPEFDFFSGSATDPDVQKFVSSETRALIETLYSLPSITWVNDPFVATRNKVKFQQLFLAECFGIGVPKTLITTRPEEAKKFFMECGEELLTKAIYTGNVTINGLNQGIPSKKVDQSEFYSVYERIRYCPTLLQEYVPKSFEVRVTVIGDRVFAVKIDSQEHEETKVDWRLHTPLNPHSVLALPKEVEAFCLEFLKGQDLLFGAMDFIVTPEGEYVFLENNPFGQYLWLEFETGLPLTQAICDLLMRLDQKPDRPLDGPQP